VAELRGAPKEGMTATRSTEGVITRSGTGTAQAPKRLTRMLANLCICFHASRQDAREPETGKSRFPERKEVGLPSFSRAGHVRTQGPTATEAARDKLCLRKPRNPETVK
jgi:hypothetical protein